MRNSSSAFSAVAIALIATGSALGQSTPTSRPSPAVQAAKGPIVELRVLGPAAMEQRLRPTHLGDLLRGPECGAVFGFATSGLRRMLAAAGDAKLTELLEQDLRGYAGELEVALWADPPARPDETPAARGHLVLWADGVTDLARLTASLRAAIGKVAGPARSLESQAGRGFDLLSIGGEGLCLTLPICIGDQQHLVAFFGTDLATDVDQLRAEVERRARVRTVDVDPKVAAAARRRLFAIDGDLAQIRPLLLAASGGNDREMDSAEEFLRMSTWRRSRLVAETAGPRVQWGVEITFDPGERALFDGVLPAATELPDLLRQIPKVTATGEPLAFLAGHLDWQELYITALRIAREISGIFGGQRKTLDELRTEANAEVGFDVEDDLLHYFTTEFAWLAQPATDATEGRDKPFDNSCFVQKLSVQRGESKPFDSACKKLEEAADLDVRETLEIEGEEVLRCGEQGWTTYVAHCKDLLLIASGDGGLDRLRQVLRPVEKATELPQSLHTRRRSAPPGWNLAGVIPATYLYQSWVTRVIWEVTSNVVREFPGSPGISRDEFRDSVRDLVPILERYHLDTVAILGGHEPHQDGSATSRIRLVW